jgi:hypothetical protein
VGAGVRARPFDQGERMLDLLLDMAADAAFEGLCLLLSGGLVTRLQLVRQSGRSDRELIRLCRNGHPEH